MFAFSTTWSRVVLAMIAGVAIYGLAMGTTYPLLGVVLAEQVSERWNGVSAAATGLGLLIGVGLVTPVCRRLGAGLTAPIGVVLMAGSLLALSLTADFWTIFAARLVLGIGANLLFVVTESALNALAPAERRGRVMGLYTSAVALGFVIGPGAVAAFSAWPHLLLLGCAAVTLFAAAPLLSVRRPVDAAVLPAPAQGILPTIVAFPFAYAFLFLASGIDAVVISLLPVIAMAQDYGPGAGALFITIFHVGLLLGQPLVGLSLDGIGRRRTVLSCCGLSALCAMLLVFATPLGFWGAASLLLVWGGTNYGLYTAGLALIGDRFQGAALTVATAGFAAVYALASTLSTPVAGHAIETGGATGFYLGAAGLYLVAAAIGGLSFFPVEPRAEPPRE